MRPNDESGKLPTAERPFRVLVIAGSNGRQYNCPGVDSKARTLMLRNHLEGRTAAFFGYGDGGGDEPGPRRAYGKGHHE
jgi:hypothetical protein